MTRRSRTLAFLVGIGVGLAAARVAWWILWDFDIRLDRLTGDAS